VKIARCARSLRVGSCRPPQSLNPPQTLVELFPTRENGGSPTLGRRLDGIDDVVRCRRIPRLRAAPPSGLLVLLARAARTRDVSWVGKRCSHAGERRDWARRQQAEANGCKRWRNESGSLASAILRANIYGPILINSNSTNSLTSYKSLQPFVSIHDCLPISPSDVTHNVTRCERSTASGS
jgi:hypothetical protein